MEPVSKIVYQKFLFAKFCSSFFSPGNLLFTSRDSMIPSSSPEISLHNSGCENTTEKCPFKLGTKNNGSGLEKRKMKTKKNRIGLREKRKKGKMKMLAKFDGNCVIKIGIK